MSVFRAHRLGLLSLMLSSLAAACECPSPLYAIEEAQGVVLTRVVELSLPPLNAGQADSLARSDVVHGRAVVIETLRGPESKAVTFVEAQGAGMCRPNSSFRLGETVMLFLDTTTDHVEFNLCTPTLRFGQNWQGWSSGTIKFRDHFRGDRKPLPANFYDWVGPHLWVPMHPPAPPAPPG